MNRRITAAAVASVAALGVAGVATANNGSSHAAKTYKASLAATPAAALALVPDAKGKAQLVDGKKNNKVSLHMKGLKAGETYLWHVHQGKLPGDPCTDTTGTIADPTPYPGWTYKELKANESGNANSKGTLKKSATADFPSAAVTSTGVYYVNVHLSKDTNGQVAGTVIACGVLKANKASGKSKPKKAKKPHPTQAKGPKS